MDALSLSAIGHGDHVSMLDGGVRLWESEKRDVPEGHTNGGARHADRQTAGADVSGLMPITCAAAESPTVRILDVRTNGRIAGGGHLPRDIDSGQNLSADTKTMKFKPREEMRGCSRQPASRTVRK